MSFLARLLLSALVCSSAFGLPSPQGTARFQPPSSRVLQRLEFAYDSGSRRVRKTVKQWNGNAWSATSDTAFVYDGWNLIAEVNILQPSAPSLLRSYVWGLDLSGSQQGAGGVGGLLFTQTAAGGYLHYAAYDGNGNVIGYIDAASGQPVSKLDYDPFGNPVMVANLGDPVSSAAARAIPFRFSTKYTDKETGLSYYGERYYTAELGRWINRDPIEEQGGVNLYGFVGNGGVGRVDVLGLATPALALPWISGGLQVPAWLGPVADSGPAAFAASVAAVSWASAATSLAQLRADKIISSCHQENCANWASAIIIMIRVIDFAVQGVNIAIQQGDSSKVQAISNQLTALSITLDGITKIVEESCPEIAILARQASDAARQSGQNALNQIGNAGGGGGMKGIPNQLPGQLAAELDDAARVGAKPIRFGDEAFESAVNDGTVKFVVTESGELLITPQTINGVEISHAVLSNGNPVLAAGQADIAGAGGQFIGISITPYSGHFLNGASVELSAQVRARAVEAFNKIGIFFSN